MRKSGSILDALQLLRAEADDHVRRRFAVALLLVIAGGLLAGLAPLALKGMVDGVAALRSQPQPFAAAAILAPGLAYLLALCGGRLLTELRPAVAGIAEQRVYARLRQRFFGHLLGLPMAFHAGQRTGALVHSLQQATTGYQFVIVHLIHSLVPVLVELATVTVVFIHLGQPALTATFAATALAYLLVFALGTSGLRMRAQAVSDAGLDTHATLTDHLLNHEVIKLFNAQTMARERLGMATAALESQWVRLLWQRTHLGIALAATFALSMATSLWLAAAAVAAGSLTIGGFVLANVYMLQMVRPLEMLSAAARDVTQAMAFIRPFLALLEQPSETGNVRQPSSAARPCVGPTGARGSGDADGNRTGSGIRFRDVHFAYDAGRPVLRGLDLDVGAGHRVAVVGASGSGKSSLVRLLLRLHAPAHGCIYVDGDPIDSLPLDRLRAMIGVVPQDSTLFDDTLAANIGIGRAGASRSDIERAARVAHLHDFVCSLPAGYDTPVGERGLRLSGGERQRIAIARVVLKRPRICVFDEATSMLDGPTEAAILHDLQLACAGCTTLTIAHRLSTIRDADEILVLADGRITERGDHASLLAQGGAYARMWQAQRRGARA